MPKKKDAVPDLETFSVKLPKQTVATVRRLARTQGRLVQFVANEAICAGVLALERGK
jgi:predicted transcriptional regulator